MSRRTRWGNGNKREANRRLVLKKEKSQMGSALPTAEHIFFALLCENYTLVKIYGKKTIISRATHREEKIFHLRGFLLKSSCNKMVGPSSAVFEVSIHYPVQQER